MAPHLKRPALADAGAGGRGATARLPPVGETRNCSCGARSGRTDGRSGEIATRGGPGEVTLLLSTAAWSFAATHFVQSFGSRTIPRSAQYCGVWQRTYDPKSCAHASDAALTHIAVNTIADLIISAIYHARRPGPTCARLGSRRDAASAKPSGPWRVRDQLARRRSISGLRRDTRG